MLDLGSEFDAWLYANTNQINSIENKILNFKSYFMPPNAKGDFLTYWETALKINHIGTPPSDAERNEIVVNRIKNHDGLTILDFYKIAQDIGWYRIAYPNILIETGLHKPFRLGISRLGIDVLTDTLTDSPYEIKVTYGTISDAKDEFLEVLFTELRPIETKMVFVKVS